MEFKNFRVIKNRCRPFYTAIVKADFSEKECKRYELSEGKEVVIKSNHNNIFDTDPVRYYLYYNEEYQDELTFLDGDKVIEYIKSQGFFKIIDKSNIVLGNITKRVNKRINEEDTAKLGDIVFLKSLEDIKNMNILFCVEENCYFDDTDRLIYYRIFIYEDCGDHICKYRMEYEYKYFQAWASGGYSYYYTPVEGNHEKYNEIKDYLLKKDLIWNWDNNNISLDYIKKERNIEKRFNELGLPFPIDLDDLEVKEIRKMEEKKEIEKAKANFGHKVFEKGVKIFGYKNAKMIISESNISSLDYLNTLEKKKGNVKEYIQDQINYAIKYNSWKHFYNILGENFPVMRRLDQTIDALKIWYKLNNNEKEIVQNGNNIKKAYKNERWK